MDAVFLQLAAETPGASFVRVEAEEVPELSEQYAVPAVPFFLFFKNGQLVDRLEGANPPELAHKASLHLANAAASGNANGAATNFGAGASAAVDVIESVLMSARAHSNAEHPSRSINAAPTTTTAGADAIGSAPAGSAAASPKLSPDLKARLEALLSSAPVLLFMKGTAASPRCGFSSKVVAVLERELGPAASGSFQTFDILADEEVRQGLKVLSDWPTYPQLYCRGELVGGCDIILQMHASGELKEHFEEKGVLPHASGAAASGNGAPAAAGANGVVAEEKASGGGGSIEERLKALVASQPVMLFMKGTPEQPRCGFSRKVVTPCAALTWHSAASTFSRTRRCGRGSRRSSIGRRTRSCTTWASWWGGVTSFSR
eukprot:TRINITY_DN6708_c0_g1_i3.p1 TRINITY_DN6708_c0_g1~~TRINITY_DN6708_c0_g1_i3.p1  ORF type:complete len:399 (+),score=-23.73 TRINITY_DN6708_c0_g1_i3:74-1198(+)